MLSDLRLAFRQLVKSPGFAVVAILTLALGIGANTAIFSVINSALLKPLHFSEPEQLVELWTRTQDGFRFHAITGPQFKQLRDHSASFASISVAHRVAYNMIDRGKAERIRGLEVSGSYLRTFRIDPLHGAGFGPHAGEVGGENNGVLLTYEWWQSRFGGDRAIVGQSINLGGASYVVAGVLPPHALARDDAQFLVPLAIDDLPWRTDPDNPWAPVVARLKPGVSLAQAEGETGAVVLELQRRLLPDRPHQRMIDLRPVQDVLVADSRPTLLILLGAVGLVLLIACANVANLLLVRATGRQREMAVRSALGATAGRIVRQMLAESVLLSLLGGIVGVLVAMLGVKLLGQAVVGSLPQRLQPTIDLAVLGYSLGLAFGTGILFGLFPALRARRTDLARDLKESSRGSTSGTRTRAQSLLIVSEIALTSALLIGAGLLLRSFVRLMETDLGFNTHNALVCDVAQTGSRFANPDAVVQYHGEVVRRLEALPGVVSVGTCTTLPLSNEAWGGRIGLSEQPVGEHKNGSGSDNVGGHYFEAMGIPLLKGRVLTDADNRSEAPRVAVINETLAGLLLPGQDPIGRHVRLRDVDYEVVGIVRSIRHGAVHTQPFSRIYVPHVIEPYTVRLVIRTRVAPESVFTDVRRTFADVDPEQSISNIRTLEQVVSKSLQERRVTLALVGLFAVAALGLACLGIYGVMAYSVGQRARELSIRMALGAQREEIVRLVLRDGLGIGLAGIGAGLVSGYIGARLIASRLYEVSALDPLVFAGVAGIVALVAFAATYLPARRAAAGDALLSLRAD